MSDDLIVIDESQTGVMRVVFNRPQSFNPLSRAMLDALQAALNRAATQPECRVVVLAASGKAFSAGHDLAEMRAHPEMDFYRSLFDQCSQLMMSLVNLPQPVIAQVNGIATAAVCQLVSMCDLAVASDTSRFAVSGINFGLFCSTPSVGLSRAVSRKKAMEMLLTGDFIDAQEAQRQGLINRSVPADQLDAVVQGWCLSILSKPRVAVQMGKRLFYRQLEMGLSAAYQAAGETMACNMMDDAAQEGFSAFLEKRTPKWRQVGPD